MSLSINRTDDGVCAYPIHTHEEGEIMIYTEGRGVMRTDCGDLPFDVGTAIFVPAGVAHGSCAPEGFCNISIRGDLPYLLAQDAPTVFRDTGGEVLTIASLLYRNRYGEHAYLYHLLNALAALLLKGRESECDLVSAIRRIEAAITERASDAHLDVCALLLESGYAKDYIRAGFKRVTGMTPTAYLARVRIDRARHLIDIYGDTLPFSAIAEMCGYLDYVYFSKSFRARVGVSPRAYNDNRRSKETV